MEYYTHNAVLNISGRRTVYVGLSQNKPQLLWRMVMKEHVPQCSCECGFCVPNLSSIAHCNEQYDVIATLVYAIMKSVYCMVLLLSYSLFMTQKSALQVCAFCI